MPKNLVENINTLNLSPKENKKVNTVNKNILVNQQFNRPTNNKYKEASSNNETDNKKYKEYLKTFVKNKYSIYTELKGTKFGETKLEDIKNFLISEKNNPEKKNGLNILK